jgi:NADH-quinone oxidoreductase subunit G
VSRFTDGRVHGVINRGDHAEISTYIEKKQFDNDFFRKCKLMFVRFGALTDKKPFVSKSRVWFTNPVDAHRACPTCFR